MARHWTLFLVFQIRVHIVDYIVEVVSCFFISCLEIDVINISLVRLYH